MSSPVVPKSASPEQLVAALIRLCEREFLASHEIAGVLAASLLVANLPRARSGAANPRGQEAPERGRLQEGRDPTVTGNLISGARSFS